MSLLGTIRNFLKQEAVQKALAEDNLDVVYALWKKEHHYSRWLTRFFLDNNIDPLNYVGNIVDQMYQFSNIDDLNLSNSNIETIGQDAFENCIYLESVNTGNVSAIDLGAFSGCTALKNVKLGSKLKSIENEAFTYTTIEQIYIPKNVTYIGLNAFSHNHMLREVITDHTREDFVAACSHDCDLENTFGDCPCLEYIACSDGPLYI